MGGIELDDKAVEISNKNILKEHKRAPFFGPIKKEQQYEKQKK